MLENIIHGCKQQKPAQQWQLFELFAPVMMTTARRYTATFEEAEDVLQDAFLKVFQAIGSYEVEKGALEPWIRRIVVHTAIQAWRKKKRQISTESLNDTEFQTEPVRSEVELEMDAADILVLLAELPEGYRLIFNLFAIDGHNHSEIAALLGISESTSRSQLARARKQLQEALLLKKKTVYYEKF